jgi:putative FmdB family regulatory protein
MPIREYRCSQCGEVFEILEGLGFDTDNPRCQKCGSTEVTRLLSPTVRPIMNQRPRGATCCGREERCETPPCSTGGSCRRD